MSFRQSEGMSDEKSYYSKAASLTFIKVLACFYIIVIKILFLFFSIAEKKQKSRLILIYLNSTLYSTHAPRPLRSLGAYRFTQFELLRKLKVCRV